ncbi:hypothetical protein WICPIJ_006506 [Wickerhamomyces pijperi]|uniref:Transcriptional regulatory protein RXT2 N-terminal domain-containing protein n=1 Tax=Wickerhamomyces pijperi TaxID=599730 RepID=A0A9P8Q3J4_WICPI|nr:hypothetical protein WICPIJ_006506 [Wickerhamomyces pijperi]
MTEDEFPESEVLNLVTEFSETIKRNKHNEVFEDAIQGQSSNRGNKLLYGAEKVHRDRIDGLNNDNDNIEAVEYNRATRTVYKRRRLDTYNLTQKNKDTEQEIYSGDGLEIYKDIDIEAILAPISNPTDLITRPSIASTYNSNVLKRMANHSIETIEKEQNFVIKLSSLLDTLLGEGGNQILESDLQLPVYKSILDETTAESTTTATSSSTDPDSSSKTVIPSSSSQDATIATTSTDSNRNNEPVEESKRVTRRHSTQVDSQDPFFALPQFLSSSQTLNIDPDLAERARQLTTIALQRNEEYIRNLTNLRLVTVRAQRLKEKLQDYARELNGDPDEADLYLLANPPLVKEKEKEKATAAKSGKDTAESGNDTAGEGTEENSNSNRGKGRSGRRRGAA